MRDLLYQWIIANTELTTMIPADRWIQQGAVDNPPERPFAVLAFTDRPRTEVGSAQPRVTVYVHDNRGTYSYIDPVIHYLEVELPKIGQLENADSRIVDIRWEASSGDLTDDGYNTNVRTATFALTGRK